MRLEDNHLQLHQLPLSAVPEFHLSQHGISKEGDLIKGLHPSHLVEDMLPDHQVLEPPPLSEALRRPTLWPWTSKRQQVYSELLLLIQREPPIEGNMGTSRVPSTKLTST